MANTFYRYTKQRLQALRVFTPSVIEAVARFAETQQQTGASYQAFLNDMGAAKVIIHCPVHGAGVPVVDIPAQNKRQKGVLVVHIAMGNSLDENQLFQLATLAGINPAYRVIGFGNPSSDRYYVPEQNLNPVDLFLVAATKRSMPLVRAELDYLEQQGIKQYYQVGYSFGALKAVIETTYAKPGEVQGLLVIDPVSHPRRPLALLKDFTHTYKPLGKYVNAVDLDAYHAARGAAAKDRNFKKGLRRPVNIAYALLIARSNLIVLLQKAAAQQPRMRLGIAWGTASELASDEVMKRHTAVLSETTDMRPQTFRLEGLEHAFANDIYLYGAIVKQFLEADR